MGEKVLISAGDVIEVQLTSETVVLQDAHGRRAAEPGHITNRMRLFVKETDGKEKKYDFEDTELGVRETQRVAIVRTPSGANLILFNLSSGEKDTFEPAIHALLGRKPFFGPLWKAIGVALVIAVIFYLVSHYQFGRGPVMAGFMAGFFAFLTVPVLWWLCKTWDRVTEGMRFKAVRKKFLADMEGRVRAYAPDAHTPV